MFNHEVRAELVQRLGVELDEPTLAILRRRLARAGVDVQDRDAVLAEARALVALRKLTRPGGVTIVA